jgi:exonuclease VII small subunit
MKTLSKAQVKELAAFVAQLREQEGKLESAHLAYAQAVADYNSALEEAREWRDTIVSDMENYMETKSEKWEEGEAGSEYSEWKAMFEEVELDEIDEPDGIEVEHADALEGLSIGPGFE